MTQPSSLRRRALAILARDIAGLVGAGLIIAGLAQIYAPAGIIVAGAMLLVGAILLARRG